MTLCLSPNGSVGARGYGPLTRLMVGTIKGVHTLERQSDARNWSVTGTTLATLHISALLHEPRSGRLYAGAHGGGGLWMSADEGATWRQLSAGLPHPHIYTIAAQYRGDQTILFAGTEPAALFRSDD